MVANERAKKTSALAVSTRPALRAGGQGGPDHAGAVLGGDHEHAEGDDAQLAEQSAEEPGRGRWARCRSRCRSWSPRTRSPIPITSSDHDAERPDRGAHRLDLGPLRGEGVPEVGAPDRDRRGVRAHTGVRLRRRPGRHRLLVRLGRGVVGGCLVRGRLVRGRSVRRHSGAGLRRRCGGLGRTLRRALGGLRGDGRLGLVLVRGRHRASSSLSLLVRSAGAGGAAGG